jgi:mono/diheme cytochrome c family protein
MFRKIVNVVEVLALIAATFVVVMLFVAEPPHGSASAPASGAGGAAYLPETGALPTNGAEIYTARCAGCHGSDGGGGSGPRLAGKVAGDFPDIEDQIAFVSEGKGGMPAFGGSLSAADLRLVVEYTRTALGG